MNLQTFRQGGSVAVITGAAGGMGRACSRRMGLTHRLVLAEMSAKACEAEAQQLRDDGYDVAEALACDVSDAASVDRLATIAKAAGPLGALVHTAGLSPEGKDWQGILRVNYIGTVLLLEAFLQQAVRGSVACCIASNAGHMAPPDLERETLFDRPGAPGVLEKLEAIAQKSAHANDRALAANAYVISKRGVLRLVQDQVRDWAEKGARIVSISPGLIRTPMGLREAQSEGGAAKLVEMTPAGRWGAAMDIANAVHFLCSPEASFITGCDLLVDGGLTPLVTGRNAQF